MRDPTAHAEPMSGGVGVFGGTFDPVHLGHLRAAEEVRHALGLARVLFVPSGQPPHKSQSPQGPIATAQNRLAWLRLAIGENPRFEVDPIEIERGGTSFSIDTLRSLKDRFGGQPPTFLIGCDAFALIASWREPKALFELANFAVMTRPPQGSQTLENWLPERFREVFDLSADGRHGQHLGAHTWIRQVDIPGLDISSSAIREGIDQGRSVRYLMPEAVYRAVRKSGIYGRGSRHA